MSAFISHPSMHENVSEEEIQEEIVFERLKWRTNRECAQEIVQSRGWSEKDEDYGMQVEQEARRLWEEDLDLEIERFSSQ
jgi:hypothetical protein